MEPKSKEISMRNNKLRMMLIVFCTTNDALTGGGLCCENIEELELVEG